jgi:hypothetical protein
MRTLWLCAHGTTFVIPDDGTLNVEIANVGAVEITPADFAALTDRDWVEIVDGVGDTPTRVNVTDKGKYWLARWSKRNRVMLRPRQGVMG